MVLGQGHPKTQSSPTSFLASNLLAQHQCPEAKSILDRNAELWTKNAQSHWRRFLGQSLLGGALTCLADYAAAEPLLLTGYKGLKEQASKLPANEKNKVTEAGARLVQLYTAWNKPDLAADWQRKVAQ